MARERVLVAMSGGVDSSVAAALLHEQGFDLVGVTLHLWDAQGEHKVGRCCAPEDRDDARLVCEHLGVPHYTIDSRHDFRAKVVEPFMDAYLAGQTPSPCVHCNREVKLEELVSMADDIGARWIASGHYARISHHPDGFRLFRGRDGQKDQSYFLYGLPQHILARLQFPLGSMHKSEVRAAAHRLELPNAHKGESQELCFVPDGDVAGFIAKERGAQPAGNIRDTSGEILGSHSGLAGFTIGQRRGLALGGGAARYVLRILPDSGDVIVGPKEELLADVLNATEVQWLQRPGTGSFRAYAKVRYRHTPAPAEVSMTKAGFRLRFDTPQRAITPGQAVVLYDDERVIGGGLIAAA